MRTKPTIHPYLALVVGASAISTAAVLVKLSAAPAAVVAAYRLLFTICLMTPFVLIFHRKELGKIERKDWLFATVSGAFLALHFILWFESLNYTSVASSVVLVTLQPLFTFVGAYLFFKERLHAKAVAGGLIAISGSIVICWGDIQLGGMAILGNLLALAGAIMVSGYWLVGQSVRQRLSLASYTYVVYGISTLFLIGYVLVTGQSLGPYPSKEWLLFLALAIVPTLLGHSVFNWVLKWVSASVVSVSILFEPVGATFLAYIVLDEHVQLTQWLGGSIILFGVYLFLTSSKRVEAQKKGVVS